MTVGDSSEPVSDPEFFSYLIDSGEVAVVFDRGDGMWAGIAPLIFHWTLKIGIIGDRVGYEDRWCFQNEAKAILGLLEWKDRGWKDEPTGWHRHPNSCRRRENGDPNREEIRP